jgi:hypothetical protein
MACATTGTATVRLVDGNPEWVQSDEHIHIAKQLVEDETAWAFVSQRYELDDWCYEVNAFHAHLTEATP